MTFPSFLSSLIIASSATATLLFGILTYIHTHYNLKILDAIVLGSLLLTIATNALIIIAFYQMSDLSNELIYPLLTYFIAMFLLIIASFYVFFSKIAKIGL